MLCDETITSVRHCAKQTEEPKIYFDCFGKPTYYLSNEMFVVLDTAHFEIWLSAKDVDIIEKEQLGQKEIEWNEWKAADLESAIITGQKLRRVEPNSRGYTMEFDDVSIRVSEWNADCLKLSRKNDHWSYREIAGMQCYLEKRCRCGGMGQLFIGFVFDYVVRCRRCKRATYAYMDVWKAIAEWNERNCICDLSDITIE